jgi:hypothetical protein
MCRLRPVVPILWCRRHSDDPGFARQEIAVYLQVLLVRHSRAALSELQFVEDVKRQPRDLGQVPSEGRFSTAGISEYGRPFHGVLHYHAIFVTKTLRRLLTYCGPRRSDRASVAHPSNITRMALGLSGADQVAQSVGHLQPFCSSEMGGNLNVSGIRRDE